MKKDGANMNIKTNILVLFFIVFIICFSGCIGENKANIVGSPTIDENEETDIQLFSENITISIYSPNNIYLKGEYVSKNPTNKTINQSVVFNFSPSIPYDFKRTELNGNYIDFYAKSGEYYTYKDGTRYKTAIVNVTFLPYESNIFSVYHNLESTEDDSAFEDVFSLAYINKDGNRWNGSIKYANFTIILDSDLYDTLEINGNATTSVEKEIIVKKIYTNWKPDININIKCRQFHIQRIYLIIGVFIAIIILLIALIIWYKKYSKNPPNYSSENNNKSRQQKSKNDKDNN